tara:strand:- start:448 stop:621 length:174 start_codon:yes stop_codon:yes gene_type:complete
VEINMGSQVGLYDRIHAKRKRIKAGSGEKMKRKGAKGRPTAMNFRQAALTAKNRGIG